MTDMSRRDFFTKSFRKAENPEVIIGKISDFPVGKEKVLEKFKIVVESLPEGLKARSTEDNNNFYSIKTNQVGELVVNRAEDWSPSHAFSILTNELIFLDTSLEDRI